MKKLFNIAFLCVSIFCLTNSMVFADCPDWEIVCVKVDHLKATEKVGSFMVGTSWSWPKFDCVLNYTDVALAQRCNSNFSGCGGACAMCYWKWGEYHCIDTAGRKIDASKINPPSFGP